MQRKKIALFLNVLASVLGLIGTLMTLRGGPWAFLFYTLDSNIVAMISSFVYVAVSLWIQRKGEGNMGLPAWVHELRYVGTCTVALTLIVVLFILMPMYMRSGYGFAILTEGAQLYHHTLCPALSLVSFIFFEDNSALSKRSVRNPSYVTGIYAVILIALNLLKVLEGPYPFLFIYRNGPVASLIWAVVVFGIVAVSELLVLKAAKVFSSK